MVLVFLVFLQDHVTKGPKNIMSGSPSGLVIILASFAIIVALVVKT